MITYEEMNIIKKSIEIADSFGLSRISVCKENIVDNFSEWTDEHERAVFNIGERNSYDNT